LSGAFQRPTHTLAGSVTVITKMITSRDKPDHAEIVPIQRVHFMAILPTRPTVLSPGSPQSGWDRDRVHEAFTSVA
jgi:hypothetical protein